MVTNRTLAPSRRRNSVARRGTRRGCPGPASNQAPANSYSGQTAHAQPAASGHKQQAQGQAPFACPPCRPPKTWGPLEGGPFVTVPSTAGSKDREPRARPREL